jgi:hypothetical protein
MSIVCKTRNAKRDKKPVREPVREDPWATNREAAQLNLETSRIHFRKCLLHVARFLDIPDEAWARFEALAAELNSPFFDDVIKGGKPADTQTNGEGAK